MARDDLLELPQEAMARITGCRSIPQRLKQPVRVTPLPVVESILPPGSSLPLVTRHRSPVPIHLPNPSFDVDVNLSSLASPLAAIDSQAVGGSGDHGAARRVRRSRRARELPRSMADEEWKAWTLWWSERTATRSSHAAEAKFVPGTNTTSGRHPRS